MSLTKIAQLVVAVASISGLAACVVPQAGAQEVIVATNAPPPPRYEVIPAPPAQGYEWHHGHWKWEHGAYVWEPGHFEAVHYGQHWVPDHWKQTGRGWEFVHGYWR